MPMRRECIYLADVILDEQRFPCPARKLLNQR
jgi:hypothetical protein